MKLIKKQFNSDSEHQYMIKDGELYSINIYFDTNVLKDIIQKLSKCDNNTNCILVDDETIRSYNIPAPMYCAGLFKLPKNSKATFNYLVPNNKLLFLLNYFYQKAEKGISLTNDDLNYLYRFEYDYALEKVSEQTIKLIRELKDSTKFDIKRIYNYERTKKLSFESTYVLMQENLPVNALTILGVLENANDNSNILQQLNIDLEKSFQKVKA